MKHKTIYLITYRIGIFIRRNLTINVIYVQFLCLPKNKKTIENTKNNTKKP